MRGLGQNVTLTPEDIKTLPYVFIFLGVLLVISLYLGGKQNEQNRSTQKN